MNSAEPLRTTDVLIIGGGLAGCAAAYAAARKGLEVMIITSCPEQSYAASYNAQGGIIYQAEADTFESYLADFQKSGAGLNNVQAVETLFRYGKQFVDEILIDTLQVPFNRVQDGRLDLIKEGAHALPRIAHVMDYTGKAIQERFWELLKHTPGVTIKSPVTAVDLITLAHHSLDPLHIYEPSTCAGAYVYLQDKHEVHPILARFTILATGGLGRLYLHSSNPHNARGDGYAMAYRAGARLMNMEYVQFHPTTLYSSSDERFLISEAVRGAGGILRNAQGEDFMPRYHELGSLAPRDVVARSIMQEISKSNVPYVYLDITHKSAEWLKARFPVIYQKCLENKIDMATEGIPVVPAAHYECGGIATNQVGDTTIQRLKAVGEVACTGLHGANRLASSSLLECLVYGTLAGDDCATQLAQLNPIIPRVAPWKMEKEPLDPDLFRQDRLTIKHTMWNYVGIVRTRKKLERAFGILWRLQQDIESFYANSELNDDLIGLRNAATTAMLVLHAARLSKSSRGCHFRVD